MITSGPGYKQIDSNTMSKPILIVGGGPAGLAAAHALARVGQTSVLVEKADRLGGAPILSGYAKLVPTGEWASDAIGGMVDRVRQRSAGRRADERHGANRSRASPGAFSVPGLATARSVDAAAAILAPASRTSTR